MGTAWANHGHDHRLEKQSGTLERVPELRLHMERKTGFEPATLTLAR
jgi:hypothetical protein